MMNFEMMTRLACGDDMPCIIDLWKQFMEELDTLAPDKHPRITQTSLQHWSERLQLQISHDAVFVGEAHERIIGFIGCIGSLESHPGQRIPPGIAYIVDLYVIPEARRNHVAFQLMNRLIHAVGEAKYTEVWINTATWNLPAKRLFEKMGFILMTDYQLPHLHNQVYFRRIL
jgi:ribosomal protein S18 acetylase RimI-like enzyme